jgi:hypothetical protein
VNRAVFVAQLCFILNVVYFSVVLLVVVRGVWEGLSQDDSLLIASVLFVYGLIGLVPLVLAMTLLWSLFLGKSFKVTIRTKLLMIGLYVIVLASTYELLIGFAL